jgi:hypothetical protein
MVVGTVLGIRGILNIVDIYHLVFVCTLFLMLCAISHFRVAVGIIEKYQKKINELGVK